jgi:tRNA/rRNA methyltransferase
MDAPDPTRFILIGTSHPANVGAAARAMKVMGFADLVLVSPRHADVHRRDEAIAMASGARRHAGLRARVVGALDDALDGLSSSPRTAMTPRDFGPATSARVTAVRFDWRRPAPGRPSCSAPSDSDSTTRTSTGAMLPQHSDPAGLRLAEPRAGGAADRLRWRQALGGFECARAPADAALADGRRCAACSPIGRGARSGSATSIRRSPARLMFRLHQLANRVRSTRGRSCRSCAACAAIEKALPSPHASSARSIGGAAPGIRRRKVPSR